MKDSQGREIDYMRISVTDRCNLRCTYCMPDGIELLPMAEILTFEEILRVCRQAVELGITRFKVTGGEPLVRRGCVGLIDRIRHLPGVEQVTLTTNGVLLREHLDALLDAGLDAVNISLDTLKRERFVEITGSDHLEEVLAAVDAAVRSGLQVKINTVLEQEKNAGEWQDILELAWERNLDVRFIELMPIGNGAECTGISNETLFEWIREKYPDIHRDGRVHGNGPAVYYHIPGFAGSVGFISPIHCVFCGRCNRIRMTATGELKPCLCYEDTVSVRDAARHGEDRQIRAKLEEAVLMKPKQHCFDAWQDITEQRKMIQIGG